MFRARHREDRLRGDGDEGAEYDVLYQNQRGAFVLGVPFFSSKALSGFEPSAWTDGDFVKSRVGVAEAQLPDPSWEWAWRSWYVDMGGDVDEEGWGVQFLVRARLGVARHAPVVLLFCQAPALAEEEGAEEGEGGPAAAGGAWDESGVLYDSLGSWKDWV